MNQHDTPAKVASTDGLGPLPEADGTAEANKERHPEGGYTFDEIPAWSEPLVRAYAAEQVAAERQRCAEVLRYWLAGYAPDTVASYEAQCLAHILDGRPAPTRA